MDGPMDRCSAVCPVAPWPVGLNTDDHAEASPMLQVSCSGTAHTVRVAPSESQWV